MSQRDMSWQDEVRKKKQQASEKTKEREREERHQKEIIAQIWSKLLEVNSKLDKDIRLPVRKAKEDSKPPRDADVLGLDNSSCLYNMGGWHIRYGRTFIKNNELYVEPMRTRGLTITIDEGKLIMGSMDHIDSLENEHFIHYKYDDLTAEILLMNLCMGTPIQRGLKISKRYSTGATGRVSEGGCFIATATYRNKYSPEVIFLRNFRDTKLTTSLLGRMLINFYYAMSPAIARSITKHEILQLITKKILIEPFVWIIETFFYKNEN